MLGYWHCQRAALALHTLLLMALKNWADRLISHRQRFHFPVPAQLWDSMTFWTPAA
jgi:hypothetical protein